MAHYSRELPKTSDRLGNFDRVKVDPAQTSFFEGREFLFAHEFSILTATSLVIKIVTLRAVIVQNFDLSIDDGTLRFTRRTGGVEGGSFSTIIAPQAVNAMAGPSDRRLYEGVPFTTNTVVTAGGTLTGGSVFDTIRLKTSNATAQASSVGKTDTDQIGVPAGTRYYVLENLGTGTVTGVLRVRWEERG